MDAWIWHEAFQREDRMLVSSRLGSDHETPWRVYDTIYVYDIIYIYKNQFYSTRIFNTASDWLAAHQSEAKFENSCLSWHGILAWYLPFLAGCEPMGLFWGLLPQEGSKSGLRLRKKDVMQPHHMTLSVLPGHVMATTSSFHEPSSVLCQTNLERHYAWEDVIRVPVREGRLRGTLFIPKSKSTQLNGLFSPQLSPTPKILICFDCYAVWLV